MTPPDPCEDGVARAALHAHEDLCAERYRRLEEAMSRLEKSGDSREAKIDGVVNTMKVIAGSLILLLLGVIGYLIDRLLP